MVSHGACDSQLGHLRLFLAELHLCKLPAPSLGIVFALLCSMQTCRGCADNSERALRTQLELDTQKVFLGYENTSEQPADVTFNLKDFKAMLSLCEAMSSNVAIRFDTPGNPLVVKPHLRGTQAQVGGSFAPPTLNMGITCALHPHPSAQQMSPLCKVAMAPWHRDTALIVSFAVP